MSRFPVTLDIQEAEVMRRVWEWRKTAILKWGQLAYLRSDMNGAPISGKQRMWAAARGLVAGFPDWALLVPRHGFHGLFIEQKVKGGRISDAQWGWLEGLNCNGYKATVCWDYWETIRTLENYLS